MMLRSTPIIALVAMVCLHAAHVVCPGGQTKTVGGTTINCYCDSTMGTCSSSGAFGNNTNFCEPYMSSASTGSTRTCYTDEACTTATPCQGSCPTGVRLWEPINSQMCVCEPNGLKLDISYGFCSCPTGNGGTLQCYGDYLCASLKLCNTASAPTGAPTRAPTPTAATIAAASLLLLALMGVVVLAVVSV
ncbi:hypothetical protein FOA52_005013 [Chlamydomonas sp. UWO 241]|nr:hypothetical protein FOA52_005013 [Chlamydomonas sp. UWO 241]